MNQEMLDEPEFFHLLRDLGCAYLTRGYHTDDDLQTYLNKNKSIDNVQLWLLTAILSELQKLNADSDEHVSDGMLSCKIPCWRSYLGWWKIRKEYRYRSVAANEAQYACHYGYETEEVATRRRKHLKAWRKRQDFLKGVGHGRARTVSRNCGASNELLPTGTDE